MISIFSGILGLFAFACRKISRFGRGRSGNDCGSGCGSGIGGKKPWQSLYRVSPIGEGLPDVWGIKENLAVVFHDDEGNRERLGRYSIKKGVQNQNFREKRRIRRKKHTDS